MCKKNEMKYNFASIIMNFEFKDVETIKEEWVPFTNDIMTLCNYHHDYTVEEMIGIVKFLKPVVIFDENIRATGKEMNLNFAQKFDKVLEALYKIRDEQNAK